MQREGASEQLAALLDLLLVSERAVLVVEEDELPVAEAGVTAGAVDQTSTPFWPHRGAVVNKRFGRRDPSLLD
jgi:hypothetical protein